MKNIIDAAAIIKSLGQPTNGRYPCPVCGARRGVAVTQSSNGRGLAHCHACKNNAALWEKIRERNPRPASIQPPGARPVTYNYQDADGSLLFQVLRYEPKDFRQRRKARDDDPSGKIKSGWVWSTKGVAKVPFRLPQVLAGIRAGRTIYIAEGEKCAKRLEKIGLIATTNAGGALKWADELTPYFEGADVVILPDNDGPGRRHGQQVAKALSSVAERVRVVALPDLPPKGGDVADWLDAGHTLRELHILTRGQREYVNRDLARKTSFSAKELEAMRFPELEYIVPGFLVEGLTLLGGKPKAGKSWLCLDAATAVASGGTCLSEAQCQEGDVLYLALEDNARRLQRRLRAQGRGFPARLRIECRWPRLDDGGLERIRDWAEEAEDPRLVVIDTRAKVMPAATDRRDGTPSYQSDYASMETLQQLAAEFCLSIVVVAHFNKRPEKSDELMNLISGTTGLTAGVDNVLGLLRKGRRGVLSGRGRDLEDFDTALAFDTETCRWKAEGPAADMNLSATSERRRRIMEALKAGPASVKDITDAIGTERGSIEPLLTRMVDEGILTRPKRGTVALADSAQD